MSCASGGPKLIQQPLEAQAWSGFGAGHFNLKGKLPPVPSNAQLVKGLFNESLPAFLAELDAASRQSPAVFRNVTFLHIDCDLVQSLALPITNDPWSTQDVAFSMHAKGRITALLRLPFDARLPSHTLSGSGWVQYAGARDALALLSDRIHPGAVLVLDDLLAYPSYRYSDHVMHRLAHV